MAEAVQRYHNQREIVTLARHISRQSVKQELRERGHKLYRQYSFKQLCEQADEYLLAHIDEVFAEIRARQVRAELQVRKPKPSNQRGISVQMSGSKWWGLG
jgi:hypothetical protein